MISVIIPIYNRQNFIEECLRSILTQSYQNFEILIIDDGSTDQTVAVCKAIAKNEPRIKLFEAEHGGVSAARNIGLEAAKGDFVFFVDSDDVIHPLLLETLVTSLKNTDAGIAGTINAPCSDAHWHKVAEAIHKSTAPGKTQYKDNAASLYCMFTSKSPFIQMGGNMIRKDLIGDTKFRTDISIGEDFYFIYELLLKGCNTVFLEQKWYYLRLHEKNSSWDFGYTGFWTRFYRRKLVWENEEKMGRAEYANRQKRSAFKCFLSCIEKNKPYSEDSRKMRAVLREYKKVLLPALNRNMKILYLSFLTFPATTLLIYKTKPLLKLRQIIKKFLIK